MLATVTSIDQVIANICAYQTAVQHSKKAYPERVRAWYYLPQKNIAGASRFIGYQDRTAERYDKEEVWGGVTQRALEKLGKFVEVKSGPLYDRARAAAERLLPQGKTLRTDAKFHILLDQ